MKLLNGLIILAGVVVSFYIFFKPSIEYGCGVSLFSFDSITESMSGIREYVVKDGVTGFNMLGADVHTGTTSRLVQPLEDKFKYSIRDQQIAIRPEYDAWIKQREIAGAKMGFPEYISKADEDALFFRNKIGL
jgi:hypothetical protein